MNLSKLIKEKHDIDYSQEIAEIIFFIDYLTTKLEKNRLLKEDRERLLVALEIIKLGEY